MPNFYRTRLRLTGEPQFSKIFLAEGLAEALFLDTLFSNKGYDPNEYCVFCFEGITKFGTALKILCTEPNFKHVTSLGIMVDADSDPNGRLKGILGELAKYDLANKRTDPLENNIFEFSERRIGIFISPGGENEGRIETMIVEEIASTKEDDCISEFNQCISSKHNITLDEKAIVQIYISLKRSNLCGTGRGFEAGIFDIDHKAYRLAVRVFTEL